MRDGKQNLIRVDKEMERNTIHELQDFIALREHVERSSVSSCGVPPWDFFVAFTCCFRPFLAMKNKNGHLELQD